MKKSNRAPLRFFAYGVEIVLLWVLQSTPNLIPEVFSAKPFLLIPLAIAIASKEDKIPSLIFGAICGLITDISAFGGVGLFAIGLTLICYGESHLLNTYFRANIFSASLAALFASAVLVSAYFLINAVFAGIADLGTLFLSRYLPRIIYTFVCFFPLYAINAFLYRRLK